MDRSAFRDRKKERGQTIILVALSMTALLAMAAISIDVVSLYVARSEAQHSAEAAALAGAKAFVTSGYTSGFVNATTLCSGGAGLAELQAQAAAIQNKIAGVVPSIVWAGSSCDLNTQPENPRITIQVQRTGLPLFFAKIWNVAAPTVTATATAEAYNPSGGPAPIQVSGVKPWLVPDCAPSNALPPNPKCQLPYSPYFVNVTDGTLANGGSFIGQKITLTIGSGGPLTGPAAPLPNNSTLTFYPLVIDAPTPQCPSPNQLGCNNNPGPYYNNISCFNPTPLACGESITNPPLPPPTIAVDDRIYTGFLKVRTEQGTQCLIHAGGYGLGQGQDIFPTPPIAPGQPVLISPGSDNPDVPLRSAAYVSRSDSVVTVPLFDGSQLCPPGGGSTNCAGTTKVVGFLQLGIIDSAPNGTVDAIILNASGCNSGSSGTAVSGGDVSPIPVRLVRPGG